MDGRYSAIFGFDSGADADVASGLIKKAASATRKKAAARRRPAAGRARKSAGRRATRRKR